MSVSRFDVLSHSSSYLGGFGVAVLRRQSGPKPWVRVRKRQGEHDAVLQYRIDLGTALGPAWLFMLRVAG